ncbi:MAG TPA: YIP1 family protein [Chloroflexota bacterium]|nr:YIP1 family protein [Chloroflexota bacterium]
MPFDRMIKAAMLDAGVYEELERDTSATTQAFTVVLLISFISGLGAAISRLGNPGQAVLGLIGAIVAGVVGWIIWSYVTYFVGTKVFNGTATPGELLRTIGFAFSPNVLGFFSFIPCLGALIALAGSIWSLVAAVVAVRQSLDFDTGKAILTVIIGWFALLLVIIVLSILGLGFLVVAP